LLDTGAQVSLVKYEDLKRDCSLKGDKTRIMGITGDSMEV
jgi:Retroviral aspartyl protease.